MRTLLVAGFAMRQTTHESVLQPTRETKRMNRATHGAPTGCKVGCAADGGIV
jgi:hypothetical protein